MATDTLLLPDWVIPVHPQRTALERYGVALRGGRIVAVAPHAQLRAQHPGAQEQDLAGCALLPGFVNLHTHAAMGLLRGAGDDLPLMVWLRERIWPLEHRLMGPDFVYDGSVLAFAEMLAGGTTCCADMYFHPEQVAQAALAVGLRVAVGSTVFEIPGAQPVETLITQALAALEQFRGEPKLRFTLDPHAPYTVGDDTLWRIAALAEEADLGIAIHLQETRQEVDDAIAATGMRPAERLARLGLLSPRLVAVHGVHLNTDDIALLAAHGASLAHCPASNLKLASGIAPVAGMAAAGLNIGLGTDGAASNNRLDMLGELRLAALLAKGASGDASALPAHAALHAATLGGARALGWDADIGSIEVGKCADLVAIRLDSARLAPVFDPVSHIVYAAGREDVETVWVDGEPVAKKLQLSKYPSQSNLERIMSRVSQWRLRASSVISGTNAYLSLQ
ncbi:5-methylthioadenosine/S-adenosylhomocysteine deaminase [Pigmentiphaga humi]|uniref:5-methylthioadenosine/S-adenosylhomocysteine deaminase n=1 Tax=Pigmentiphaga humi TaxID=2478468 RepID=A0A3P4B1J0_9BURK|nr:TRZ/ATZ family hydrolase [Pigmentiphaga humi]VCU69015.1 5-methylthioadenosine/S-adenosylhomocysteine deaminase [Pigmentiphaga humi]